MTRVTRILASALVAGTIVAAPLATSAPGWAKGDAWAKGDGLVNVQIGNGDTTTVPVQAVALNCINVSNTDVIKIAKKIDQKGGTFTCTTTANQTATVTDNK
jgi:hypothetical protein